MYRFKGGSRLAPLMLYFVMSQSKKNITDNKALIAGEDYPRTYREFVSIFPDDESCADFLATLRWPDGFVCQLQCFNDLELLWYTPKENSSLE